MSRQVTSLPVIEKTVANGNWDTSRKTVNKIIIHTMVGTAVSANARFNNSTQQVSAHYGVLLDGTLWHWVDEDNTAYHAGDYAVNQSSIGIEHEDNGDYNGTRPDALYSASAKLVRDICNYYQIPIDRQHILKHSEVHATGCPDALDIDRIVREAQGVVTPPPPVTTTITDQTILPSFTSETEQYNNPEWGALKSQIRAKDKALKDQEGVISQLKEEQADDEKKIRDLNDQIVIKDEFIGTLQAKIANLPKPGVLYPPLKNPIANYILKLLLSSEGIKMDE